MIQFSARIRLLSLVVALGVSLGVGLASGGRELAVEQPALLWASPARTQAERVVFLGGGLSHPQIVTLGASLAASRHPGVLLLDSVKSSPYHRLFLEGYRPQRILPVGSFPDGESEVEQRLGTGVAPAIGWTHGAPLAIWQSLFPEAERVVLCPAQPYRQLLQAACLAAAVHAPLYVVHGEPQEAKELRRLLDVWHTKTVYAVAETSSLCKKLTGMKVYRLADEQAVAASYLRHLVKKRTVRNLVIANPTDVARPASALSSLAPWIASQRHAWLLLTNAAGDNVAELVQAASKRPELKHVDNLILVADLQAIPMERRPNPIADGKDPYIEMEPLTPQGLEPFTYAVGRLFNDDPSVVALVLARERLLAGTKPQAAARRALVVSNSGGALPLLEMFSRNTAKELRNSGYETTTRFGAEVNRDDLRKLLPDQDIFLWEGHHNTLIKEYGLHDWSEPLQPSLVFLQSCLALKDYKAQPLIERGALCVVGSSTRIYSGSGGAFALSYFDALLYEQRSMGGALRQAKNFLLAYSLLKEKRLGKDAKLRAANLRSAWAFTLWGDPTLKLPPPDLPEDTLPPVQHLVRGNHIHLRLPVSAHEKATTSRFRAQMLPNGRLAGLISKDPEAERQKLVPFVFAEVALPHAPAGKTPHLTSRLPSSRWVFNWDARRRSGYLLVIPRSQESEEIRFHVGWDEPARSIARGEDERD